jgi:hypothetical protein
MRGFLMRVLVAGLVLAVGGRVLADDEARAVIDKAVQAHGGTAALSKIKNEQVVTRGTLYAAGQSVPFTAETTAQLPDRFKNVMHLSAPGGKEQTVVQVIDGDKAWMTVDGKPRDVGEKPRAEMDESRYTERVTMLAPLLEEKEFELTALGDKKIDGRATAGVKVKSKGHRDVELYFDKETGLLAMTKLMAVNSRMQPAVQEEHFSDYVKSGGIMRPEKFTVYQDGKKVTEGEVTDSTFPDKIGDKEFEQP